MNLSPCGIDCDACTMKEQCGEGCQQTIGKPFYIKDFGVPCCPMYSCAKGKEYNTCGECKEVPCNKFYEWRDPSMTEEEHKQTVLSNVARLKSQNI